MHKKTTIDYRDWLIVSMSSTTEWAVVVFYYTMLRVIEYITLFKYYDPIYSLVIHNFHGYYRLIYSTGHCAFKVSSILKMTLKLCSVPLCAFFLLHAN